MWLATVLPTRPALDQLADAPSRHCRIVADNDKIALALAHQFVDQALGSYLPP